MHKRKRDMMLDCNKIYIVIFNYFRKCMFSIKFFIEKLK